MAIPKVRKPIMMKYSILIPTRNGGEYVTSVVRTVLDQPFDSVEVVVSVNHSTDDTEKRLSEIKDHRLRIIRPPCLLSMTTHFEWILKAAEGEWIAIIGDDDGVMPYFFDVLEQITDKPANNGLQIIRSRRAYFSWAKDPQGLGAFSYRLSNEAKVRNIKRTFWKVLCGLGDHHDLPQLYSGSIVKSSLVEKICRDSGGTFFRDLIPDIYSSVALMSAADKYLDIGIPLFWTGTSPKSNGTAFTKQIVNKDVVGLLSSEFYTLAAQEKFPDAEVFDNKFLITNFSSSILLCSAFLNQPGYDKKNHDSAIIYSAFSGTLAAGVVAALTRLVRLPLPIASLSISSQAIKSKAIELDMSSALLFGLKWFLVPIHIGYYCFRILSRLFSFRIIRLTSTESGNVRTVNDANKLVEESYLGSGLGKFPD